MGFHEIKTSEEVAPNLVPMVDIMFLLLLFFMLNADMSQKELEDVVSPLARAAIKDDTTQLTPENARITVNIHLSKNAPPRPANATELTYIPDEFWQITMQAVHYSFDVSGLERLKSKLTDMANVKREKASDRNSPSERTLMIRADKQAPYKLIQKVYEQAAQARIYKIEVSAYIPKEEINKRAGG